MSEKGPQTFHAIVQKEGSFTFVALPFLPREAWGAKARYYTAGTINGRGFRALLGASGDQYFLRLGEAWIRDNGIGPGAEVEVTMGLEGPQEGNLAEDIGLALAANEKAKTFFDALPTFYRKNFIRWIESAKRPMTRSNRIAEMVRLLEDGKRER